NNLKQHIKNEDFLKDDWIKAKTLVKDLEQSVNNFYFFKSKAFDHLQPLADSAEEKLLEDHPLKDPLIAAKKDLDAALNLDNLVFKETIDYKALENDYTKLKNQYEEHNAAFADVLKSNNKQKAYSYFYDRLNY